MIAIATLAALGQAIQIGIWMLTGLGGLCVLCVAAVVVAVLVASRGPQWEPRDETEPADPAGPARPITKDEQAVLEQIERGQDGSGE